MNNLTTTLLDTMNHISVEEWTKVGGEHYFSSGKSQRVVRTTIPALQMAIKYRNISKTKFDALKSAYQDNHSKTFIVEASDIGDAREAHLVANASTWVFKEFKFSVGVSLLYSGTIILISSVFFNFTEYQSAFTQGAEYAPIASSDTSFTTLLSNNATPYKVDYAYVSNSIFSNIARSARHIKDNGGLRKKWRLSWLLEESKFTELLKFYRQRGGIMGSFGMPEEGSTGMGSGAVTKACFITDSFAFDKRVDGMYSASADILERL